MGATALKKIKIENLDDGAGFVDPSHINHAGPVTEDVHIAGEKRKKNL